MVITKEQLDIPICDVVDGATNEETYREFIKSSEEEFGLASKDLDLMTDEEVNAYLDFLDYLWEK